jgi:hypothetical protein
MSKAFSDKVFKKNDKRIARVTTTFMQAQQLAAQNRENMKSLLADMKVQEKQLSPEDRCPLRGGVKSFNATSMKEFVFDIFRQNRRATIDLDYLQTAATDSGIVTTNKDGLHSSISRAVVQLVNMGIVERVSRGQYRFVRRTS